MHDPVACLELVKNHIYVMHVLNLFYFVLLVLTSRRISKLINVCNKMCHTHTHTAHGQIYYAKLHNTKKEKKLQILDKVLHS